MSDEMANETPASPPASDDSGTPPPTPSGAPEHNSSSGSKRAKRKPTRTSDDWSPRLRIIRVRLMLPPALDVKIRSTAAKVASEIRYRGADSPQVAEARRNLQFLHAAALLRDLVTGTPGIRVDQRRELRRILDSANPKGTRPTNTRSTP
jgi:hypothetical protein